MDNCKISCLDTIITAIYSIEIKFFLIEAHAQLVITYIVFS